MRCPLPLDYIDAMWARMCPGAGSAGATYTVYSYMNKYIKAERCLNPNVDSQRSVRKRNRNRKIVPGTNSQIIKTIQVEHKYEALGKRYSCGFLESATFEHAFNRTSTLSNLMELEAVRVV